MKRSISPARQVWCKRRNRAVMPWISAGVILVGWGAMGWILARLFHTPSAWFWVAMAVEVAGLALTWIGLWRMLTWERTVPFQEVQP